MERVKVALVGWSTIKFLHGFWSEWNVSWDVSFNKPLNGVQLSDKSRLRINYFKLRIDLILMYRVFVI